MNNASFHLSPSPVGRHHHHPLLLLPNHSSPPNSSLQQPRHNMLSGAVPADSSSSASAFAAMSAHLNGSSPPATQLSALNFSNRDLLQFGQMNAGFPYLNGFSGMPMMPMGFGLFPQHHHGLFAKSPGMMSSMPAFFSSFSGSKDEDLWHKRSPSGMPDSPRSGSRGSPTDAVQRKKLPKGKSLSEQNVCPICGQTVTGISMQEHFFDELKTYRQEPVAVPEPGEASSSLPLTSVEADARHEVFLKVRANRRTRHGAPPGGDLSHSRRPSSSTEPRPSSTSQRSQTALKSEPSCSTEEADVIVDVVADEVGEPIQRSRSPSRSPASALLHRPLASPVLVGKKRSLEEAQLEDFRSDHRSSAIRRRSSSSSVDSS